MDHLRDAFFRAIEEVPEHRYQLLTKRPHVLLRYFRSRCRRVPSCVWLGTTLGHPKSAGRLGELHTLRRDFFSPGTVAFLSCEPLLADLSSVLTPDTLAGIGWVIVGGESGTHLMKSGNGRALVGKVAGHPWTPIPLAVDIVRKLRDACAASGAAFFFKQWGGPRPDSAGRLLDGRTHDGMPDHLPGAMPPGRRVQGAATAALARKLPVVPS